MSAQQQQQQQQQQPEILPIGELVAYEILDEEYYYRGYGLNMERKQSKIKGIIYLMENGDRIAADHKTIKKVSPNPPTPEDKK